jgi:hypothetical protein
LKLIDTSTTLLCSATKTFPIANDWVRAGFSFYASANGATFQLKNGTVVAVDLLLKGGNLIYRNSFGAEIIIAPYTANTWYPVVVAASSTLKIFDVYVGGVKKLTSGAYRSNAVVGIDTVSFASDAALSGTTYVDDVLIQK